MSVEQTPAETTTPQFRPRGCQNGDAGRVEAGLPFVEALARRMAATMPHSIDLSDLVQDGVIGLIDAAERFDEGRGIKFETFAERRIRGAMIDALRKDAWPRGVRRVRRELEAAREKLRVTLGHEPSLADLAQAIGADEKRLGKTIVRINTIESTSPLSCGDHVDEAQLPAVLVPAEPERPDLAYERTEVRERVRAAIETLPVRERRVISLYYYGEVMMKEIGAELGVNESRVSQLHARALRRLREALGADDVADPRRWPASARRSLRSRRSRRWRRRVSVRDRERPARVRHESRRLGKRRLRLTGRAPSRAAPHEHRSGRIRTADHDRGAPRSIANCSSTASLVSRSWLLP